MGGCGPIGVAVASSIEVWSSNPVIGTIFDSYTMVLKWQNWLNYKTWLASFTIDRGKGTNVEEWRREGRLWVCLG